MRTIAIILIGSFTATAGFAREQGVARDKAIRECSEAANRFKQVTFGAWEHHQYRTCMKMREQKE